MTTTRFQRSDLLDSRRHKNSVHMKECSGTRVEMVGLGTAYLEVAWNTHGCTQHKTIYPVLDSQW